MANFGTTVAAFVSNMEAKRRINGRWFQSVVFFAIFGLFTAKVQAQIGINLLPPTVTVPALSTNVSIGDTATFSASAGCVLPAELSSTSWQFNGGPLPTNASVVTTYTGLTMVSSTLTVSQVSPACTGTYTMTVSDVGLNLLGIEITIGTATSQATLGITPTVIATTGGSPFVQKGFKIQSSGPNG